MAEELTRGDSTIGACLLLAGFYCVRCQTDANVRPAYWGLSLIPVEADTPGVIAMDVGEKIAHFQATQHKLADMATKSESGRLLTYKAAWNFDRGYLNPS